MNLLEIEKTSSRGLCEFIQDIKEIEICEKNTRYFCECMIFLKKIHKVFVNSFKIVYKSPQHFREFVRTHEEKVQINFVNSFKIMSKIQIIGKT